MIIILHFVVKNISFNFIYFIIIILTTSKGYNGYNYVGSKSMPLSPCRFDKDGDIILVTLKPFERVFTIQVNGKVTYSFDFPKVDEDLHYNLSIILNTSSKVTLLPLN